MTTTTGSRTAGAALNESRRAPSQRGIPGWVMFVAVQACLLGLTATMVYYEIFSKFTFYDDEGFMMLTVRHVLDGHRPYDDVVTAYGPVYYLYKWVLHGLIGLPLSHDVVRLNTAVMWMVTALLSSAVVFGMTRSFALATAAHLLVVLGLRSIANEPGHPQEMGVLIVAAIVLASVIADGAESRRGIVSLGMFVGLLAMIKVNVGVFAGAAVWMALSATLREGRAATALRALSAVGIVALLLLLTWRQLDQRWTRFAVTEVAAVVSVLLAGAASREDRRAGSLVTFASACVGGAALGLVFALIKGASLSALVECLVLLPGRLGDLFVWPPRTRVWSPLVPGLAVALSALCAWLPPSRLEEGRAAAGVAVAKLALGVGAAFASWHQWSHGFVSQIGPIFLFFGLTPFLWLVLLPGVSGASRRAGPFPRFVLVWMAVLQPLQAYPVAGSQLWCGTFLHFVCAMVALGDARDWAASVCPPLVRPTLRKVGAVAAIVGVAALTQHRLHGIHRQYEALTPLGLPGAERVRLGRAHGELLRSLVATLRENADTFLTYPGFNSLYFWTGKRPPTLDVLSHEVRLYSEERQAAMVEALLAYERPYVVRSLGLAPANPAFIERISRHFKPSTRIGLQELLVRRD
jgi:hypothetical protein